MTRFSFIVVQFFLLFNSLGAQSLKVKCVQKERKITGGEDPIIVRTCFIKNFKFLEISIPDYAGRYSDSVDEVYVLVNNKYVKTSNANVFHNHQRELLSVINNQIQKDFKEDLSDSTIKDCFVDFDSIPKYKMSDFTISIQDGEIWFKVEWGLPSACRGVDGTIVSFKISEIQRYIR